MRLEMAPPSERWSASAICCPNCGEKVVEFTAPSPLTPQERRLYGLMMTAPGQLWPKNVLEQIFGGTLRTLVCYIRRKLGPDAILTVGQDGYMVSADKQVALTRKFGRDTAQGDAR